MKCIDYKYYKAGNVGNMVTFTLMDGTKLTMGITSVYHDIHFECQGREYVMTQNGTLYEKEDDDE